MHQLVMGVYKLPLSIKSLLLEPIYSFSYVNIAGQMATNTKRAACWSVAAVSIARAVVELFYNSPDNIRQLVVNYYNCER